MMEILKVLQPALKGMSASVANKMKRRDLMFRMEQLTFELTDHGATEQLSRITLVAKLASRGSGPTICWASSRKQRVSG